MKKAVLISLLIFLVSSVSGQSLAPGAPGKDAQWASAGKQGIGTSASLKSKVWFTLQGGALTEVYYPNVAVGNVHKLELIIVHAQTGTVETESKDTISTIIPDKDSLTFTQVNKAKSGEYEIRKKYVTDPKRDVVLIEISFHGHYKRRENDYQLYVQYDPSLSNSGMHDTAWTKGKALLSQDKNIASALIAKGGLDRRGENTNFSVTVNGFLDKSDGLTQLRKNPAGTFPRRLNEHSRAEKGNVVQTGLLSRVAVEKEYCCPRYFLALGFGKDTDEALKAAKESLNEGFSRISEQYKKGWSDYLKTLRRVDPKYQAQFNMAAMVLKAHEDKTYRGANIASLSVPWGGGKNANEDNVGGYHLVWSRDLYQVFTAFMALGDKAAAERALDYLLKVQQKPDGSFPQNSWLDGKPFWGSLQHDEVAYPLIMAYQLGKTDKETYENHLKKAADFIVRTGPATPQERWEEESGYSPSTIAAEIAGLVCVAEIAKKNGDFKSAEKYLKTADEWEANIEKWTVTKTGKYGDGNYYLRITQKGNPDAGDKIELNNGAGVFDEREIVDAGFLELVRLGIKPADDPLIMKSVKVIDEVIKVNTPNGEAFYRYNNDGYGEMDDGRRWNWDGKYTGKGRLWAFLSGERGQYELALYNRVHKTFLKENRNKLPRNLTMAERRIRSIRVKAQERLDAMQKFANEGLMIPEQIWDKKEVPKADSQFSPNLQFGEGTGSATPLAWSMAQFIRLAVNLQEGKNLDTPDVVYERYVLGKKNKLTDNANATPISGLPVNKRPISGLIKPILDSTSEKDSQAQMKKDFPFELRRQIANSKASPKIVGNKAYFYYTDKAEKVMLAADFTGWKPKFEFEEVEKDFFVKEISFPQNARVEYKLIIDDKWILDPMNPSKIDNGVGGENSVLEMPNYEPSKWAKEIEKSPLFDTKPSELEIDSKKFGKRKVKIYIPSEYFKRGIAPKLPVLYLQDGSDYIKRGKAINVLERLTAADKVEPFMLVFIDPKDRMKEYWANDDWAEFVAKEVVPTVERKYFSTIKTGRENRALLGASLGGITSIWTALKYPEMFANVGGQSNSFWVDNETVIKELEKLKGDEKFNFYMDDGVFEGVKDSRRVVRLLKQKGFKVKYVEGQTGHNWTSWKDRLADAFVALMK